MTPAKSLVAATIAASLLAAAPTRAADQSPEAFYANRNVEFLIGSAAGGGYGIYALVMSRFFGKHMPGNPRIVPRMMDGAGSLTAANAIYTTQPHDGSAFGAVFMGAIVEPLVGDAAKARYDTRRFSFIGSANRETSVCIARKDAGIHSWKDMYEKKLIVAGAGWTSSIRQYPAVLNKVLGMKFEVVSGYPGSKEAVQAVEKGEAQGVCGIQWSSFAPLNGAMVKNGDVVVFGYMSAPPGDPEMEKLGAQNLWDVVKEGENRSVLELIFNQMEFGRPYIAPPGIPPERLAVLRRAFDDTMKDPEFLAEAARAQLPINPMNGADFEKAVDKLYATPASLVARAKAALE